MYGNTLSTADAGLRVVSPTVDLSEASFGAYVTYLGTPGNGGHVVAAFGDGRLRCMPLDDDPKAMADAPAMGTGAMALSGAPDTDGQGTLLGTDDGRLLRFRPGEGLAQLASVPGKWIENVAVTAEAGLSAFSAGRDVFVQDAEGGTVAVLAGHPSTPTGIAFAPDDKRLAVSRYDGVSVWRLDDTSAPEELRWHGSHTALTWSPDGRFIVTATQDNEMHCWRMADGTDMKMSGYANKIRALSWTPDSAYLAASGAGTVTSWCCAGDGPSGKAPREFGYVYNGTVTHVAARPAGHVVAGGYDDGTVMIGGIDGGDAIIARAGDGGAITALSWSPDGGTLLAGGVGGAVAVIRVPEAIT